MWHTHTVEYYSFLKISEKKISEILIYVTTWMNLEDIVPREIARHNRKNIVQYYFYEIPRAVRFLGKKVEGQFSGPGWQREKGIIVYGYRASVWNVENHLKMGCVYDCATISMYLIP